MQLDPPGAHLLDEAISKMDRFCHQIHKVSPRANYPCVASL